VSGFFNKAADVWAGKKADNSGLVVEVQRLGALPLTSVAEEAMKRGFGTDGPAADGRYATMTAIQDAFAARFAGRDIDEAAYAHLCEIVAESVQVLEHACLVRQALSGSGGDQGVHYEIVWTATRRGRSALDRGAVERALAG
jgi:hypothetical protein